MLPSFLIPVIIIAIVTLAAFLILVLPLEFSFNAEYTGNKAAFIALMSWAIFCLRAVYTAGKGDIELQLFKKTVYRMSFEPSLAQEMRIPAGHSEVSAVISHVQSVLTVWPGILRVLKALVRQTKFRRLSCDLAFGTGSPATTGLVFGIFSAMRPILMVSDRVSITMRPVFDRKMLEGVLHLDMRLERPFIVMVLLVRLFLYPKTRQTVKHSRLWQGSADI